MELIPLSDLPSISIHALLAESDQHENAGDMCQNISIHALLAESDIYGMRIASRYTIFLSTLSLRRATLGRVEVVQRTWNFYPRSPCGERHFAGSAWVQEFPISIHALLAESDHYDNYNLHCVEISIHALLAESDGNIANGERKKDISIHALLAESDSKSAQNSGALLRIWNKFYGDCIFMLTGKAVFYPFCPCFFHIFWCEGSGNFMIAFPSH